MEHFLPIFGNNSNVYLDSFKLLDIVGGLSCLQPRIVMKRVYCVGLLFFNKIFL
jgi:hypothetical protein